MASMRRQRDLVPPKYLKTAPRNPRQCLHPLVSLLLASGPTAWHYAHLACEAHINSRAWGRAGSLQRASERIGLPVTLMRFRRFTLLRPPARRWPHLQTKSRKRLCPMIRCHSLDCLCPSLQLLPRC